MTTMISHFLSGHLCYTPSPSAGLQIHCISKSLPGHCDSSAVTVSKSVWHTYEIQLLQMVINKHENFQTHQLHTGKKCTNK